MTLLGGRFSQMVENSRMSDINMVPLIDVTATIVEYDDTREDTDDRPSTTEDPSTLHGMLKEEVGQGEVEDEIRPDRGENDGDADEGEGVTRTHFDEDPRHRISHREGQGDPDHEPQSGASHAVTDDHRDDVAPSSAQRHADPDLGSPLTGREGSDAVDADGSEEE